MENKFKSLASVIREMAIDRNTKAREKVVNVGRPDKPALAKQGEIKTKIIDEKKKVEKEDVMFGKGPPDNMSSPANTQTPAANTATPKMPNVWDNTPDMFMPKMPKVNDKVNEAKDKNFDNVEGQDKTDGAAKNPKKAKPVDDEDRDLDDAKKLKGGKTEVDLNPKTDDKVNSETDEDDAAKKTRKKENSKIGQKGATVKEDLDEGFHVKDHPTFGKVLAKDGNTHLVDYDTADKISDQHKGSSVIKTMDRKKYIVKMPEHMKHGQKVEIGEATMLKSDNKFGVSDAMINAAKEILEKKLVGGQKKLDKNHNGHLDKQDFEILRGEKHKMKEEVELSDAELERIAAIAKGME